MQPLRFDVLSLLIEAKYENGESMSDVELRDNLLTLLNAGHETTEDSDRLSFVLDSSTNRSLSESIV